MIRYTLRLARQLGVGWKDMLRTMDTEELVYQMAFDLIDADERSATPGRSASKAEPSWIDLADPDAFEKLKRRLGML